MRNLLFILFIFTITLSSAQDSFDFKESEGQESEYFNSNNQVLDSVYVKDLKYAKERAFKEKLESKYSGSEFNYVDNLKEPKAKPPRKPSTGMNGFSYFMSSIFPFLLGLVVVLILLKSFMNTESGFWNIRAAKKENTKKLVSEEDEEIDEADYERRLQQSILNHDYRLATRFYYLILLNKLSQKNHIEYHRDKTNSEYLFELNKTMRSSFSYLSYIYSYVWYGEFPIGKIEFSAVEKKYKSFIDTIK